jgi:pyruvate kinase
LTEINVGDPVVFDDGKIEGVVRSVSASEVHITVTQAKRNGSNLKSERRINFPESKLHHEGLTEKDLRDLDFAIHYADMVALSFVNSTADVTALQDELQRRGGGHLGILLKIETARAFREFPRLLLAAMRTFPVGVIIARGDLAVECGREHLADLQEALLELCEAAHVPVVWATQVLDRLAKKGVATRAEITDASMSQRAECVMLGKGPYVCRAIRTLDDIIRRTQTRQSKKIARLRALDICDLAE